MRGDNLEETGQRRENVGSQILGRLTGWFWEVSEGGRGSLSEDVSAPCGAGSKAVKGPPCGELHGFTGGAKASPAWSPHRGEAAEST